MTNYWLRTNNLEPEKGKGLKEKFLEGYKEDFKIRDECRGEEYEEGDEFILYVTEGKNKYYLVGYYGVKKGNIANPKKWLPEKSWIKRPDVKEWRELVGESVTKDDKFNLDIDKTNWIGIVAREGLKLTESDFNKLKNLIIINK